MLVREPTDLLFKRCVDFPWLESNADDRVFLWTRAILDVSRGDHRVIRQSLKAGVAAICAGVAMQKLNTVLS